VWVVFAGDDPIATHPTTATPITELIANSDLATRVRPADVPTPAARLKELPRRRARRSQ
jgi:hypothetical protein